MARTRHCSCNRILNGLQHPCNLPERPLRTPYENHPNMDIFLKRSIFSSNLAMRHPLQTRKSGTIAKEFLTDLPPLLFATPRTPLAAPIPETAKIRVFSRKVRFYPRPCDAAQRAQGAQRTDGANAPCERLPPPIFLFPPQRETNLPRKVCHNTREVSEAGFGLLKNPQRPKRGARRRRIWSASALYRRE